jgi:hypothetical protein
MTNTELIALLREARVFVGFCPTTQEGIDRVGAVRDRIDAALAETVAGQPHEDPARTAYVVQLEDDLKYAELQLQEIVELVGEGGDGSAFGSVESMLAEVESKVTQNVALIGQNGRLRLEVERLKTLFEGKS